MSETAADGLPDPADAIHSVGARLLHSYTVCDSTAALGSSFGLIIMSST
jgi:hypothetical protein